MAGARLFEPVASEDALAAAFEGMVRRLLEALGEPVTAGEPLLRALPRRNAKTWAGRPLGGD